MACGDRPSRDFSVATAAWQDSILLTEMDSSFVAGAGGLARSSDGNIAIADVSSGRVLLFSREGAHLRSIGRRGRGPGEFLAPSTVQFFAGSLLVMDNATRRISRFDLSGDSLVSSLRMPGSAIDFRAVDRGIVVASADAQIETALAHSFAGGDSLARAGALPASYTRFPRLKRNLALGAVAPVEGGIWLGMQGSNGLDYYEFRDLLKPARSIDVPRVRRRGVPLESPEKLESEVSYEQEIGSLSMLWALGQLSDNRLSTVHVDATMSDAGVTAFALLSIVDAAGGRGCIDLTLPTDTTAVPILRFEGDTLFDVVQRETEDGKPQTWVRWQDVRRLRCG
jgi:hypothetical protein